MENVFIAGAVSPGPPLGYVPRPTGGCQPEFIKLQPLCWILDSPLQSFNFSKELFKGIIET